MNPQIVHRLERLLRRLTQAEHQAGFRRAFSGCTQRARCSSNRAYARVSNSPERSLMAESAIDFCNFDGSWSGGPTEWRRVAAMALAFDVKMCHHEEAHIGGHLLASIPHGTFADTMDADRDPIWNNMIANRPDVVDGHITLPERPGLGWELDEDFIQKYRISYQR